MAGDQYKFRTNWDEKDVLDVLATGSAPWSAGTEYHVSLVFAKTENGFDVTIARRNATTGAVIATKSTSVTWSPATLASMDLRLGWSWDSSSDAAGKFDEVRIWNHALTEDEIVAGIKAGKDTLPPRASGVGAPTLPSGTSLSVASGATLLLCGASQTVANAALFGTIAGAGTLTATGGFNPGGDGTIGTMVIDGGAKLAGDVVLDFAVDGSCDQFVFAAGGTYDVSAMRLVPSSSGAAAWNALRRFTIGNAADAVLTGTFDISAFPNAQVRQKPNGDLELLVPNGMTLLIK